jgi:ribosomal protein S18 acetylase RimI-like enzyme
MENILVRKCTESSDLFRIANIASENFSGMRDKVNAELWVDCKFRSYPVSQYFLAVLQSEEKFQGRPIDIKVIGYALWTEHGGLRPDGAFIELEQVAVLKEFQKKGIGSALITQSFEKVRERIKKRKSWIRTLKVTTDSKNTRAQNLYRKILGVETECCIKSPYRDGECEAEMFARFDAPNIR